MPDDYKISDLSNVVEISNNDLMEISAVNSSSDTGYSSVKATMTQIAEKIANGVQYSSDLETTAKTLVGAINEVNAGGGGGGASSLDDLDDVDIDSPQDGQILLYDDANDEWVNGDNVAKSLAESIKTTDETPYQLRQTPITANRTLEKLIGVSCAFNQLVQFVAGSEENNGITFTRNADGTITTAGTSTSTAYLNPSAEYSFTNHKILFCGCPAGGSNYGYYVKNGYANAPIDTGNGAIANVNGSFIYQIIINNGVNADGLKFIPQAIDLTACYGSEVADYFYNLEQNTAGAGVALFRQLFPEDYYSYQTATLISSKPTSKVIKDSNDQTIATYPLGGDELRGLLQVVDGKLVAYGDIKGSDSIIYRNFEERAYASGDESLPNAITDGTNTVVELTTPTTSSGTPFANPMLCGSTEEFTDSRTLKMFCGHQSQYYTETEGDKLSALPDIVGEAGRFVIESDGGKMSLSQIKDITGTLTAGSTSITLSDALITTSSTIDVYTDTFGVNPTNVVVATGSVTLTFESQSSNVNVKVRVS